MQVRGRIRHDKVTVQRQIDGCIEATYFEVNMDRVDVRLDRVD